MNRHKTEVLFVGGPLDNQIRVLDETHAQYVHREVPSLLTKKEDMGDSLSSDPTLREYVYIVDELRGECCAWRVARLKESNRDELLQRLVDWYCGGELKPKCNLPRA